MSSLTEEWQLKTKRNSSKHIIDINSFDKKVKTFRVGKQIYSKQFKIGNSSFLVQIYPGGNKVENKKHVSVFLANQSDWRVKAKGIFSIQNSNFSSKLDENYFQSIGSESGSSWGFDQFMPHVRCKRNNLLNEDGMLTLQVDVELLEEEILADRDLTNEDTTSKLGNLEQKVNDQTEQIKTLQKSIKTMETRSQSQMNELKNMIRDLTLTQSSPGQQPPTPRIQLECPVCMEVARRPMRLKQCGQGHIICDSCHARAEKEANAQWEAEEEDRVGNPDMDLCHTCRDIITGRPSELERILGLC